MLVFCDTEKKPYKQYEDIKRKINEFHGVETAADEVIMFGNPCTMQIIAKHWTEALIKTPAKPVNAPLIEEFTGVFNYKGRADQIETVMEYITVENYAKGEWETISPCDCHSGGYCLLVSSLRGA